MSARIIEGRRQDAFSCAGGLVAGLKRAGVVRATPVEPPLERGRPPRGVCPARRGDARVVEVGRRVVKTATFRPHHTGQHVAPGRPGPLAANAVPAGQQNGGDGRCKVARPAQRTRERSAMTPIRTRLYASDLWAARGLRRGAARSRGISPVGSVSDRGGGPGGYRTHTDREVKCENKQIAPFRRVCARRVSPLALCRRSVLILVRVDASGRAKRVAYSFSPRSAWT
jgi:hypothetical protein